LAKETITISDIRQDEWINPFGATPEELIAGALEDGGLVEQNTTINGKNAHAVYQAYCKKKNLFQETTRLGTILLKENLVTREQLDEALQKQAETGQALGEVLIALTLCTQSDIDQALAHQQTIREEFYRMEQARETRRTLWGRIIRFLFDSREVV
jgi:hypothetical protein